MRIEKRMLLLLAAVAMTAPTLAGAVQPRPVTYVEGAKVREAFSKGAPLVELAEYKVHASRREAPGQAEVHVKDTDIIYVLEGRATLVTGGDVVDGKTTAVDEIRGSAIAGGETRQLMPGDLMIVPNGTPHWFKDVEAPFLYYVVKVTNQEAR